MDRDLAPIGALIGHPARAAMLAALADGRALPAGELARHARVTPATATAHLRRLVDGGLVRVRAQGRHRYHELAGPDVAAALEAIARIAPPAAVRSLRQAQAARGSSSSASIPSPSPQAAGCWRARASTGRIAARTSPAPCPPP
jgi:DNA-binding transcriptional ArsR family regulator